jgi:hypothetical protein
MAIPFPTPQIPILGQAIVVRGFTVMVLAQCQCHASGMLQLAIQINSGGVFAMPVMCPSCRASYAIQGFQQDQTGMLQFTMSRSEPAPDTRLKLD